MTTYYSQDGDSYHARQAQGVHPEDAPLVAGGQGRDELDMARDLRALMVTLGFGVIAGFTLALVSWLIH